MAEILIDGKKIKVDLPKKGVRVNKLLLDMGIYPETAVVLKDGELLCDDDVVKNDDKLEVVVAISKG